MYFLGSTGVTIRNAFARKHERVEDKKEKYKLAKREFNTIAKLGVIMGIKTLYDSLKLTNHSI